MSFSVTATSVYAFGYQWEKNGTNISGATGSALALNDVQASDQAGYCVVLTNQYGAVTSAVVTLTVQVGAAISHFFVYQTTAFSAGPTRFAAGVCTVENASAPRGPWLPLLNYFTTNSGGTGLTGIAGAQYLLPAPGG